MKQITRDEYCTILAVKDSGYNISDKTMDYCYYNKKITKQMQREIKLAFDAFLKDKKKVNHCIDPLHIYIIGKNNLEYLKSKGFENLHLICDKPFKYDPIRRTWWQKLEVLKYAMEDFDEIVYLDWDTYLAREIPDNFWDSLGKKDIFQACLRKYACKKLCHREGNGANK